MTVDSAATARQELLVRVRDVLKAVRVLKQQTARRSDVPSGTLGVLFAIDGVPDGCHSKDLAAYCALDPSTISRTVAALVRAGLVARTADPADGRASRLAVTPHGRSVLGDVAGWYDDLLADALQDWSVADLKHLATLLQRFSDDLLTHRGDRTVPAQPGPATDRNPHKTLEAAR